MKRIALFCDGTWNDETDPNPTNVYLLSQSIAPPDSAGNEQLAEYFSGVGTEEGTSIRGGAWGMGLDRNVLKVYRRLCEIYDVGDEIYVFGFSRGAYTARSLGGLMRTAGILGREHLSATPMKPCGSIAAAMRAAPTASGQRNSAPTTPWSAPIPSC
ncbi:MAG: DUF2235 domain-containing protein [Hyphomonadaceae bacterium]